MPRRPARAALSRTLPCDGWSAWGAACWGDGGFVGDGANAGCRGPGSGFDANPNPDTSITCNRTARCRGEAKSWPYRPKGRKGWVPGIASRAGGAGLTGRNRTGPSAAQWRAVDVNRPVTFWGVADAVWATRARTVTGGLTSPARLVTVGRILSTKSGVLHCRPRSTVQTGHVEATR
jgi:hypothetical protein